MNTIYIDTHFKNLVMGYLNDGKLICKKVLNSNKHSENTINMLKEILEENKLTGDLIDEVIVINGPGSFTGVRIGVVIAKIMSYTKNIKLKAISYLQALDLDYDQDINIGISDRNGIYVGSFDKNHNLKEDYYYLTNEEYEKSSIKIEILDDQEVDIEKIYKYLEDKEEINPHLLKPLYVKKIEVTHD